MEYDPFSPFNQLPMLPPQGYQLEDRAVLKKALSTQRRLFELKEAVDSFPHKPILLNNLLLMEMRDSCALPGDRVSLGKIMTALGLKDSKMCPEADKAVRAKTAILSSWKAVQSSAVTQDLILEMGRKITGVQRPVRDFSTTMVFDLPSGRVSYTPPEGRNLVLQKIGNLLDYLSMADDTEPLVRATVVFYQLNAIQPFASENECVCRMFLYLLLVQENLLSIPLLNLGKVLAAEWEEYINRLQQVRVSQAWNLWIRFMLDVIEQGADESLRIVESIRIGWESMTSVCKKLLPRVYSPGLIELLFEKPYCRITDLVDRGIAKRQTSSVYLRELEKMGLLRSEKEGRDVLFVNTHLMQYLE